MPITATWTDPNALDLLTNSVLTQTVWEQLVGDLLYVGAVAGVVKGTSAGLQVMGNVGIGQAPQANAGLAISGVVATGNTTEQGIGVGIIGDSGGTGLLQGIASKVTSANAAYTLATAADFYATQITRGTGSTITSAYGLYVEAQNAGNTNNYGGYFNAPSGGSGQNIGLVSMGGILIAGALPAAAVGQIAFGGTGVIGAGNGGAATLPVLKGTGFGGSAAGGWVAFSIAGSTCYFPYWT